MAVVAGHAASQAGTMASRGAYQSTRVSMRAWSNLMTRNSATKKAQEQVSVDTLLSVRFVRGCFFFFKVD